MLSISEMDKEQLKQEIMEGINDLENDRVYSFDNYIEVLKCVINGDIHLTANDYDGAEKLYKEAISKNKGLAAKHFYRLGCLYYKFEMPEILYSKLYFELALNHGIKDASYYLATIYEWEKEVDNIEYNSEMINNLYELAAVEATDAKVRKLANDKFKNTNS